MELTRLLALHPQAELRFATSDRWVGESVEDRLGPIGETGKLRYVAQADAQSQARACAVVFLATPAEASLELVPRMLEAGAKVIDLSGAFRLRDEAAYPKWY